MAIVDLNADIPAAGATTPAPTLGNPATRRLRLPKSKKMAVGLVVVAIFVVLAVVGPVLAPYKPNAQLPLQSLHPSSHHWLGQTTIGGDIFSQLLSGARPTIIVSFLAGIIATALAVIIGITAGYVGGIVDEILSLIANVFLVIPALPLLIAIGAFLGPGRTGNPLVVSLIIGFTGWAWGARVMRAQALSMRNRDFVEAARIIGEGTPRIVLAEIMPNLTASIASSFLFTTIYAIGTYVGLGFLTVISAGTDYNWGTILFDSTSSSAVEAGYWWWYIPPGLAIALLGTALALVNFGIDEYVNPRLRSATSARQAKKLVGVALRPQLGFTPVVRRPAGDTSSRGAHRLQLEEHT